MWRGTLEADFIVAHRYFLLAKTLNKSDVAPRNRVIDPRGLESPSPIFKTLILSLVSFSQTVCQPVLIPTCYAGHSTDSLERPWGCERMRTGGEGDDKGWDGWMSSLTQWTWVGSWWWTRGLACCNPWGCKESDKTEWLNWTELTFRKDNCSGSKLCQYIITK